MLKTAARILLLRVLPGRLIPLVTIAEAVLLVRSVRRRARPAVGVNDPNASRTAAPPHAPRASGRSRWGRRNRAAR